MHALDLVSPLRSRPFKPFRLVLLDGTISEVRHPDLVIVAVDAAHVGYPDPSRPGAAARVDIVGLQAVSRIEFIDPSGQPANPGQGDGAAG